MNERNWYAAKLLFESKVDDSKQTDERLCEESIRLVLADNDDDARARAEELGRSESHEYPNEDGARVEWVFRDVLEVQDLCVSEIEPGVEVFSVLFWRSDSQR